MEADDRSISCIILAGGASTRLGSDKTLLTYRNKRLIDIVIECVAPLFSAIYISGKTYMHRLVSGSFEDEVRNAGPISGIHTALKRSKTDLNFIVGADYPLIDRSVVRTLRDSALRMETACDGLIPQTGDGFHPLFAFYRKRCARYADRCMARGCYRVRCIEEYGSFIHYRPERETAFWEKNFTNINLPKDYERLISGPGPERMDKKNTGGTPPILDKDTKKRC